MKPPKMIKVGANKVGLELVEKDFLDTDYGRFSAAEQNIKVANGLSPEQEALSVLHECLHACFWDSGLCVKYNKEEEEVIVRLLEGRIGALLGDNPRLVKYLMEKLG